MGSFLQPIDISDYVGTVEDETTVKRVRSLMQVIMASIQPDSWFPVGGDGSVRSFYNLPKQRWYLVISNLNDIGAALQTVLNGLKPPP